MAEQPCVVIPDSVTVCVTSCGRLDLLAKTMASFRAYNSGGRFIVSEDSADPQVIEDLKRTYPDMKVLHGPERLGLMRSIDRLYSAADTPYIFHLEDDWGFDGPVDWEGAIALLEARDDIANVSVRAFDEIREKYRERSDASTFKGRAITVMRRNAHPEFFGWSPNPGLIKRSLYETYKPFSRLNPDQMSALIKKDGRSMAYILPGVGRHIGHGRNVVDPTVPARPKNKLGKFMRGLRKQLYYAGLRREPY